MKTKTGGKPSSALNGSVKPQPAGLGRMIEGRMIGKDFSPIILPSIILSVAHPQSSTFNPQPPPRLCAFAPWR